MPRPIAIGVARGGIPSPIALLTNDKIVTKTVIGFSAPVVSLAFMLTANREDLFFWSSPYFRNKFSSSAREDLFFYLRDKLSFSAREDLSCCT